MAASPRIVALNLGMQTVSMAEFQLLSNGGLSLKSLAQSELIVDPAADATRAEQIETAVTELRNRLHIPAKQTVHYCLPSQSVFTRFVKLPGTTPDEVASIIGFEAQQNVPFPIDEVVWDYQIMGEARDNMWDVVLVAIKSDQLTEINAAVKRGCLKASTIDAAPMALYNAFRYNYSDLTGCSLLIDIGARTTNLIFIEGQRTFTRGIPVGGNSISAAVAKEFQQEITVAERLKLEKGFVSLGGAYADPEDPTEAKVSKIVRSTFTRLHSEIARSISFYRQHQGGSQPVRSYLCGGAVSMSYSLEFFNEKLHMPVEFFNPLRNVTVENSQTADYVVGKAHTIGELVGCALRAAGHTPIEINLRPPAIVREQDLAKRKPFLVLAAISLILALGAWWFYFFRANAVVSQMLELVNADARKLEQVTSQFDALEARNKKIQDIAAPLELATAERAAWAEIFDELGAKLPSRYIWITHLIPLSGGKPYKFLAAGGEALSGSAQLPTPPRSEQIQSGPSQIDALQINGLYLANPPNEKETRIIDEYVEQLQKSEIFKIEDRTRVVTRRTTPTGENWAYDYTLILPLRKPILLP